MIRRAKRKKHALLAPGLESAYAIALEAERDAALLDVEGFRIREGEYTEIAKGKQAFDGTIDGVGYKAAMDNPKPGLDMIPPTLLFGVGAVLTHGAKKYSRGNWMRGMSFSEVQRAVLSHIEKWASGETLDPESELPHLDHAACGLAFLSWYQSGPRSSEYCRFDDRLFAKGQPEGAG